MPSDLTTRSTSASPQTTTVPPAAWTVLMPGASAALRCRPRPGTTARPSGGSTSWSSSTMNPSGASKQHRFDEPGPSEGGERNGRRPGGHVRQPVEASVAGMAPRPPEYGRVGQSVDPGLPAGRHRGADRMSGSRSSAPARRRHVARPCRGIRRRAATSQSIHGRFIHRESSASAGSSRYVASFAERDLVAHVQQGDAAEAEHDAVGEEQPPDAELERRRSSPAARAAAMPHSAAALPTVRSSPIVGIGRERRAAGVGTGELAPEERREDRRGGRARRRRAGRRSRRSPPSRCRRGSGGR